MMGMMKRYFFERRTISEGPDAETRQEIKDCTLLGDNNHLRSFHRNVTFV